MRILSILVAFMLSGVILPMPLMAQSSQDWIRVTDATELRNLLSGKVLYSPDFALYYRSDGAMGFWNKNFNSVTVRKWVVDGDGKVCTYIYVTPDKLVSCTMFARSTSDPSLVRITIVDRGYSMQSRLSSEPPKTLIDAVNNTAGPAR